MIDVKNVMEQLAGPSAVKPLIAFMEQHFEDFPEIEAKYREAILQEKNGEQLAAAIDAQTTSDLLFSAALGLKANLDHFHSPIARTFLEVDPELYLQEIVAHNLPQFVQAQKLLDATKLDDNVLAYITYMRTIGPKLAHYFGYLLGNELLPKIVPGYQPDPILTIRYKAMLEQYCGIA